MPKEEPNILNPGMSLHIGIVVINPAESSSTIRKTTRSRRKVGEVQSDRVCNHGSFRILPTPGEMVEEDGKVGAEVTVPVSL